MHLKVCVPAIAMLFVATAAMAGSPHFVSNTVKAARSGDSLIVTGKEAGLGDEEQVHVVASVIAACLNPGENFPEADNKETFSAAGDFPVQNGKTYFSLVLTASFEPHCAPPMSIVFGNVTVIDTTNNITTTIPGPF